MERPGRCVGNQYSKNRVNPDFEKQFIACTGDNMMKPPDRGPQQETLSTENLLPAGIVIPDCTIPDIVVGTERGGTKKRYALPQTVARS